MFKRIILGFSIVTLTLIIYLHFALLIRINYETQAQTEAIKYIIKQNDYIVNQNNAIIKRLKVKLV